MNKALVEVIQRKYVKGQHKAVKPRDAASILLFDQRGGKPTVLMGRRNPAAKFMPGVFVFPGGRLETTDADVPHSGVLSERDIERLGMLVTRPSTRRSRGLALAAIRETFEETGLRLGVASPLAAKGHPDKNWAEFLAGGMVPSLDGVRFMARAITPPGRNRRFDTRFFMRDVSDVPDLTTIRPTPESELVELVWVPLDDVEKIETVEITQIILGEIRKLADAGFADTMSRALYRMRHKRFERVSL